VILARVLFIAVVSRVNHSLRDRQGRITPGGTELVKLRIRHQYGMLNMGCFHPARKPESSRSARAIAGDPKPCPDWFRVISDHWSHAGRPHPHHRHPRVILLRIKDMRMGWARGKR
jgi:hypothetical protein